MVKNLFKSALAIIMTIVIASLVSCLDDGDNFDAVKQLEKDQKALGEYISANGYTNIKTDTVGFGIKYTPVKEGDGASPVAGDYMYVDYVGKLLSDEVFDENDSVYVLLGSGLIAGWQVLMPYMREGGEMVMFIPSGYAYGRNSSDKVPENSPLVFEVKLHEILSQLEYEQAKIDDYLESKKLVAETDTVKGLRYIIETQGTGNYPKNSNLVRVSYTGKFLANEEKFTSANNTDLILEDLLEGWQILLPYISEGGTITMFIPSKYAYGKQGTVNIPPNSTLIFEVTLHSIEQ